MKKISLLLLTTVLCISFTGIVSANDNQNATRFQQYEQQDRSYGNPRGYMLPPVMPGMVPYGYGAANTGYGANYYYNQEFVNQTNPAAFYTPTSYPVMPFVWFNPVDFAGDDYADSQRKSTSTLVRPGEYSINKPTGK